MRSTDRLFRIFTMMLMAALLLPACIPTNSAPDCRSADVFCVGMVIDVGKVKDKGVNQFTWDGVLQAEQTLGIKAQYIETTNYKDYDKNIATFGDAGYDMIITVGYNLSDATIKAAGLYPTILFMGVDQIQVTTKAGPANLTDLNFPEDEAGFLAGALAAQMSASKKVGGVCSTDLVPMTWQYCQGFKAGAAYIDPAVQVSLDYHSDANQTLAFNDPEWGAASASAMVRDGADVIFGAGGDTGNAAVTAAAQMGKYAIAADSDQYDNLPDAHKYLLTSVTRLVSPAVFNLIKLGYDGNYPTGNYAGGIELAPYHDLKSEIPARIKTSMKLVAQQLVEGSVKTNVSVLKP